MNYELDEDILSGGGLVDKKVGLEIITELFSELN